MLSRVLQVFFKALNTNSTKAYYGYRHVRLAADRAAVATLLISDALFRCRDPAARRSYVRLVDDATAAGSVVRVFSSMHVSGEQLTQMSGVAALLRFAIEDMEEASAPYAKDPASRIASGGSGSGGGPLGEGGEEGEEGGVHGAGGETGFDVAYDSDASSDSDASYKKEAASATAGSGTAT